MSEHRDTLERELERLHPPRISLDQLARRRDRKRRNQRIEAGVLGVAIAVALGWWGVHATHWLSSVPADDSSQGLGIFADVRGWITYGSPGQYDGHPELPSGIWAVDPEDPDEPPVQLSPDNGIPIAWSSDGSKLLIHRSNYGKDQSALIVLNPDGSETLVAVAQQYSLSGGSFTPDGSKVVYAADIPDSGGKTGIFVVDAESGVTPELLYVPDKRDYDRPQYPAPDIHRPSVFSPSFSPDGSRIAYVEGMGDWGNTVWVMNSDGTERREIIGGDVPIGNGAGLQWSPDGTRLVVGGTEGFYALDADGSALTLLADGLGAERPQWSPDGSRIAFQRYADPVQAPYTKATLYSIAPDGSHVRSLGHVLQEESDFGPWSYLGPWNPLDPGEAVTPAPSPTD
jgi:Tol biopolymer transport system component